MLLIPGGGREGVLQVVGVEEFPDAARRDRGERFTVYVSTCILYHLISFQERETKTRDYISISSHAGFGVVAVFPRRCHERVQCSLQQSASKSRGRRGPIAYLNCIGSEVLSSVDVMWSVG